MRKEPRILISLLLGLATLQGCAASGEKVADETQPADRATVAVAIPSPSPQQAVATSSPVVEAPVVTAEKQLVAPAVSALPPDRYTVVSGDTLWQIAEKKEVYGDARLWPLLQRANRQQVGPQGQLSIGQVLIINRSFSNEEKAALIGNTRSTKPLAAQVNPAVATAVAAPVTTPVAAPVAAPAAAPVPVATAPVAASTVVAPVVVPAASPAVPVPAPTADLGSAQPSPSPSPAAQATAPASAAATAAASTALPTDAKAPAKTAIREGEFLNAARRAFSVGDLPWSIHYYHTHLSTQNRDANAWGELGNVYFSAGNLPDSAQAYFNAASILIDQGQTARAIALIPAIEAGNPGLAEAIHLRLTTIRK
jgi:hypothetical protein